MAALLAIATAVAVIASCEALGATTPPKIIQTEGVRFPPELGYTAVSEGEASLALKIDSSGRLTDALVTGYSHKAFATEALDAVRRWEYEPARRDGEPVDIRVNLRVAFTTEGRVTTVMPVETPAMLLRKAGVPEGTSLVCAVRDLDTPVKVLHPATPVHPGRTAALPRGRTVVDFYIDEQGRARVPVITESTHPAFSFAVMKALEDWRFAAPKRKGRPVIVRLQQEFLFENGS